MLNLKGVLFLSGSLSTTQAKRSGMGFFQVPIVGTLGWFYSALTMDHNTNISSLAS